MGKIFLFYPQDDKKSISSTEGYTGFDFEAAKAGKPMTASTSRKFETSIEQEIVYAKSTTATTTTTTTTTTSPRTRPQMIDEWFNGNKGQMEAVEATSSEMDNYIGDSSYVDGADDSYIDNTGDKRFYEDAPPVDHVYSSYKDNEPDVYGAVIQTPDAVDAFKTEADHPDEFGILTSLLFRKDAKK